jgi:PAS domain-containing protein
MMEVLRLNAFARAEIDRLFDAASIPPPQVVFDPLRSALVHPNLQTFADLCDRLAERPGGAIRRDAFQMEAFGAMADFMLVVERVDGHARDGWQFTYSGVELDALRGEPILGKRVTDIPPAAAELFMAVWEEAVHNGGRRAMTVHRSSIGTLVSGWRNIAVPLTCDGEGLQRRVDGFVCFSLPEITLAPGLDAVPEAVLIVDGQNRVCLANRAAREVFDTARGEGPHHQDLTEYTRSDLTLFGAPGTSRRAARQLRQICRCLINGKVERMDAVVSTLLHNGAEYFVVSLRRVI